jgi:hypothetical protein
MSISEDEIKACQEQAAKEGGDKAAAGDKAAEGGDAK